MKRCPHRKGQHCYYKNHGGGESWTVCFGEEACPYSAPEAREIVVARAHKLRKDMEIGRVWNVLKICYLLLTNKFTHFRSARRWVLWTKGNVAVSIQFTPRKQVNADHESDILSTHL